MRDNREGWSWCVYLMNNLILFAFFAKKEMMRCKSAWRSNYINIDWVNHDEYHSNTVTKVLSKDDFQAILRITSWILTILSSFRVSGGTKGMIACSCDKQFYITYNTTTSKSEYIHDLHTNASGAFTQWTLCNRLFWHSLCWLSIDEDVFGCTWARRFVAGRSYIGITILLAGASKILFHYHCITLLQGAC